MCEAPCTKKIRLLSYSTLTIIIILRSPPSIMTASFFCVGCWKHHNGLFLLVSALHLHASGDHVAMKLSCGVIICWPRIREWLKLGVQYSLQCNKQIASVCPLLCFFYFSNDKVVMRLWPPTDPWKSMNHVGILSPLT